MAVVVFTVIAVGDTVVCRSCYCFAVVVVAVIAVAD